MSVARFCVNTNCSCVVRFSGDACCEDCEKDAASALTGACGCGHPDCEPAGLEASSEMETADLALV
jgi:hypothetical protein